jgi:ABC-type transport system involved in cytochrome c biogenesis permease subunit
MSCPETHLPKRRTRRAIAVAVLTFCAVTIEMVLWQGDPTNSLHTSALSWSYSLAAATVGGYIFGAVWDNQNVLRTSP